MKKAIMAATVIAVIGLCGSAAVQAQESKRVYIVDHDSWEASSAAILNSGSGVATAQAGIRRVNTEQVNNLAKACSKIVVTSDPSKADLFVVWDTKTWQQTSWTGHQNEFAVYNRGGDLVGSGDAHTISGAAKDVCKILQK
jgi:hypothetical protein